MNERNVYVQTKHEFGFLYFILFFFCILLTLWCGCGSKLLNVKVKIARIETKIQRTHIKNNIFFNFDYSLCILHGIYVMPISVYLLCHYVVLHWWCCIFCASDVLYIRVSIHLLGTEILFLYYTIATSKIKIVTNLLSLGLFF